MKTFYKSFFFLMIPMALKELIAAFINLLDTVMLGDFGKDVIAAVGIANQWYFLYTVVVFGICGGAGVFAAQYWGANDIKKVKKVLGLNIILVFAAALVFVLPALIAPEMIIRLFRNDTAVVEHGVKYLRIACFSYLFAALTSAYDMSLCCSGKANIPFVSRFIGLIVNFVANWTLIFGKFGFPRLGIEGAAIATIIARAVELLIMLGAIYGKKLVQAAKPQELFNIPKGMPGRYFKAALPVMINEGLWALGTTAYSWVFAKQSTDAMVVITIVQNLERLLLVFFHGGGNATGIIVGKLVGAEEYDKAYYTSKQLCILNIVFSALVSVVFILIRPLVLLPYNITPEIYKETMNILFLTAIIMNVKSLTFLLIVGVFRNGGATRTAAIIDITSMWLVGVPLALVAGLYFRLPLFYIYLIIMSEEIVKVGFSIPFFLSKKWIKNLVR